MGGNIETGKMDVLTEDMKEEFAESFHQKLDKLDMQPEERERRHDEGPPFFRVDEILELRGCRFRVARIDSQKLILRPVRG